MANIYPTTDDDLAWMQNLPRTGRSGLWLMEHLQCVDVAIQNKNRAKCSFTQVANFRRVFCRAFADNRCCFGLPRVTPKHIAIVDLSGKEMIFYSERTSLIRLLCMVGPEASERVMTNVETVLRHAAEQDCSVLFCFSLPWQAGVHQLHWEVRTLERRPNGTVRDGARCYSYTNEDVRTVASTTETEVADSEQLRASIEAMKVTMACCDIDMQVEEMSTGPSSCMSDERSQKMAQIMAAMKADRARLVDDMNSMKSDQTSALAEERRVADERVGKVVAAARKTEVLMEAKFKELSSHVDKLREQNATLEKVNANLVREKATQDLEFGNERTALAAKANLAEMSARSATDKLSSLQKSSKRERDVGEKGHAKALEDLDRRLSDRTLEVRRLERRVEDHIAAQQRLDAVCDGLVAEKKSISYENSAKRRQVVGLQCTIAVAAHKHAVLQTGMEEGLAQLRHLLATAEGAAHLAETGQEAATKEVLALKAQLSELANVKPPDKAKGPDPDPIKENPTVVTMVSMASNTEPPQDPVELLDLRAEVGKLNTEKENWQLAEAELRGQLAELQETTGQIAPVHHTSSPTGCAPCAVPNIESHPHQQVYNHVYNSVSMPPNGGLGWPCAVDLGTDPNGDTGVEALVEQLQCSMRTIVSMARQGVQHKHAADNLWSEIQGMKRVTAEGQWQPHGAFYADPMGTMAHWNGQGGYMPGPAPLPAHPAGRGGRRR